jgi:hypothetical protein
LPQPARTEVEIRRPATRQQQVQQSQQSIDGNAILSRVYFSSVPNEQFYLTTRMQLVHLTKNGLKVLGRLTKTNNPDYPYYFDSEHLQPLFVTAKGALVNKRGQRVGYLA